jgi:hypothetical protein
LRREAQDADLAASLEAEKRLAGSLFENWRL